MRILFTFSGGSGHLEPLVPLARAAAAAGHIVAFAARPWMVPSVEAMGFSAFPSGSDVGLEPVTRPLIPIDMERELLDLRDGFGRRIARERATDLLPLCAHWRPDIVAWDETDFGAPIVAERLGLPHATILVTAAGSFVRPEIMAEALDDVRAEHSLQPDPTAAMLDRYLVLSQVPASFRDPAFPPSPVAHGYRPSLVDGRAATPSPAPPWATRLPGAPLVYFTLGTVFNHESGDLFPRVLAGLRDLPVNLLVTVGREIDPTTLGPQPANVTIERFVAQADVLPHVDLVVSHGGSGSVLGALAFGIPMLLVPMGADQPLNAARCAELGVGLVLDTLEATPIEVRAAAGSVLAEPSYRAAAQRLRDEIAALPAPEHSIALLERLGAERRPIPAVAVDSLVGTIHREDAS